MAVAAPLVPTVLNDVYITRRIIGRQQADVYALRCQFGNDGLPIEIMFEPQNNSSYVRIPTVLAIRSALGVADLLHRISQEIRDGIPRQIGSHVFISYNILNFAKTYVTQQGVYESNRPIEVNSIYPVMRRSEVTQYRLCLGLLFRREVGPGDREFDSIVSAEQNMQGSDNITEQIFETEVHNQMMQSLHNSNFFAIYMCGGARLIVDDNRTVGRNMPGVDLPLQRAKSYFQQGSLVIMEGQLQLNIQHPLGAHPATLFMFPQALQNSTLFPPQIGQSIRQWFDPMPQKQFVIFLGSHESSFRTSCWRLRTTEYRTISVLEIPDGGYIVAIEPWDQGFKEIYWRHRYERLCEGVIYNGFPVPEVIGLGFRAPNEDMLDRILGSGQGGYYRRGPLQRDFTVQLQDYIPDPNMRFQPMFNPEAPICERTLFRYGLIEGIPPPLVSPFRPPIKKNNELCYSLPKGFIDFDPNTNLYQIGGQHYKLSFGTFNEYQWVEPMELAKYYKTVYPFHPFDPFKARVGIDMRVYHKPNDTVIGQIETYFFEKFDFH